MNLIIQCKISIIGLMFYKIDDNLAFGVLLFSLEFQYFKNQIIGVLCLNSSLI